MVAAAAEPEKAEAAPAGGKKLVRRILQSRPEARPTIEAILQDEWFLGQGLALLQVRDEVARVRQPIPASVGRNAVSTYMHMYRTNACVSREGARRGVVLVAVMHLV